MLAIGIAAALVVIYGVLPVKETSHEYKEFCRIENPNRNRRNRNCYSQNR